MNTSTSPARSCPSTRPGFELQWQPVSGGSAGIEKRRSRSARPTWTSPSSDAWPDCRDAQPGRPEDRADVDAPSGADLRTDCRSQVRGGYAWRVSSTSPLTGRWGDQLSGHRLPPFDDVYCPSSVGRPAGDRSLAIPCRGWRARRRSWPWSKNGGGWCHRSWTDDLGIHGLVPARTPRHREAAGQVRPALEVSHQHGERGGDLLECSLLVREGFRRHRSELVGARTTADRALFGTGQARRVVEAGRRSLARATNAPPSSPATSPTGTEL